MNFTSEAATISPPRHQSKSLSAVKSASIMKLLLACSSSRNDIKQASSFGYVVAKKVVVVVVVVGRVEQPSSSNIAVIINLQFSYGCFCENRLKKRRKDGSSISSGR
ncbi:hypothetical protein M0804_006839 [Polistes exclamans]|nr:hypothetical protein M0804_006839 [Polistes exclamans]